MNKILLDHIRKLWETIDIIDGDALEIEGNFIDKISIV